MKLVKISMVAALLLGANAYAIDNVKVNGDARLYYQSEDRDTTGSVEEDMFDKGASSADIALHLGATADLTEGVSAGVSMTAVSTLGLENNLVSNTWSGAHTTTANTGTGALDLQVDDASWVDEAWIAATTGKTTAKLGRQALDTPFAFTETWSITNNTFEAAVLINQDIENTTFVGAYVGKSNGGASDTTTSAVGDNVVATNGAFNSFYDGAYVAGIVNNSVEPLTVQAWYYDVQTVAKAYWLQADFAQDGILAGAQYANMDSSTVGAKDDSGYAVMLGYAMKDSVTVKAAYSSVDDEGTLGLGNIATRSAANSGSSQTAQSKLYTEMWWNYGNVSNTGADSYAVTVEGSAIGMDLFAGFYSSDIDVATAANDYEVQEITVTAGKDFGPLNASVALIFDEIDYSATNANSDTDATTLQVYLTYNF